MTPELVVELQVRFQSSDVEAVAALIAPIIQAAVDSGAANIKVRVSHDPEGMTA